MERGKIIIIDDEPILQVKDKTFELCNGSKIAIQGTDQSNREYYYNTLPNGTVSIFN